MVGALKGYLEREAAIFRKYGFEEMPLGTRKIEGHRRMTDMLEYLDSQVDLLNFNMRLLLQKSKDDTEALEKSLWNNVE
jgi:hypothetical protein